jgi:hypothetical protein
LLCSRRGDVCQRSFDDIATSGFGRRTLPVMLERLVRAGFLTRQRGSSQVVNTYRLPPVRR